jgi:hypothetical protein
LVDWQGDAGLKGRIGTLPGPANVTPHAVIQPKPGIGDIIWHLPFIRAIAAVSPGGSVTFLAPPAVPIVPDGGPAPGGMQWILPAPVLGEVRPCLSRRKQRA